MNTKENAAEPSKTVTIVPCPQCKKKLVYSTKNRFRPFCSERCRVMDTAAWASDIYAIPDKNPEEEVALPSFVDGNGE